MKVTKLTTYRLPPRWMFLKIETDEGIVGWGEPVIEGRARSVEALGWRSRCSSSQEHGALNRMQIPQYLRMQASHKLFTGFLMPTGRWVLPDKPPRLLPEQVRSHQISG